MPFDDLNAFEKADFAVCLGALICKDSGVEATEETLGAITTAAGCSVPAHMITLYANFIAKAGDIDRFFAGPSAGGGAAAPAAAAGGDAGGAAPEPEKEEEPEEVDLGGGMDMFGGGDADY
uniref:60S acidic ribosomal protein P1 n=1 Tax=Phaeomonas parva TaxID=124430 RepID=A0A7S1XPS5_9STRA|mmetsp:Transcript_27707/g.87910  ORF Transcript_27707/g.87910 Transcript_27707/m.87910 type:complete len:121 (+) Transcript_27707:271-633(+)